MAYRDELAALGAREAAAAGVPVDWVLGVIGQESGFEPIARPTWEGAAGESSWGPMQILGTTARDRGFTGAFSDLLIPEVGIHYGVLHLAWLISRYGFDFPAVISAYNRGHADPVRGAAYVAGVRDWITKLQQEPVAGMPATAAPAFFLFAIGLGIFYATRKKK